MTLSSSFLTLRVFFEPPPGVPCDPLTMNFLLTQNVLPSCSTVSNSVPSINSISLLVMDISQLVNSTAGTINPSDNSPLNLTALPLSSNRPVLCGSLFFSDFLNKLLQDKKSGLIQQAVGKYIYITLVQHLLK